MKKREKKVRALDTGRNRKEGKRKTTTENRTEKKRRDTRTRTIAMAIAIASFDSILKLPSDLWMDTAVFLLIVLRNTA